MLPSSRYYATWLAIFRIIVGIFWLSHGVPKFLNSAEFLPPDGFMPQMIAKSVQDSTGFYHDFLLNVVTPNIGVFAELVRLGEVLAGCSLLLGFWTRLGGLGGAFLASNYLFAKGGLTSLNVIGGMDAMAIVISLVHFVIPTGRVLGVDALLGRTRGEPAIVPEFVDEPVPQSERPQ